MFKKICVLLCAFLLLAGLWLSVKPVFYKQSDRLEIYLKSSSSNAVITRMDSFESLFLTGIKGESFKREKDGFELSDFLGEFNAVEVFRETTEEGTSVYAYSSDIRYCVKLRDKKVNLQVFTGKSQITIGTPLIFGGY